MIQSITNMAVAHPETAGILASQSNEMVVESLLLDMAAHDGDTYRHQIRVAEMTSALVLSGVSDLPESQYGMTVSAALVHDHGKIAVSADVLNKPGKLTADEWAAIQDHPTNGFLVAYAAGMPLAAAAPILLHHTFQGHDYPSLAAAEQIVEATNDPDVDRVLSDPFLVLRGLIIAVADQHDARYPGNRAYATEDYLPEDLPQLVLADLLEAAKLRTTYKRMHLVRTLIDLCSAADVVLVK